MVGRAPLILWQPAKESTPGGVSTTPRWNGKRGIKRQARGAIDKVRDGATASEHATSNVTGSSWPDRDSQLAGPDATRSGL